MAMQQLGLRTSGFVNAVIFLRQLVTYPAI